MGWGQITTQAALLVMAASPAFAQDAADAADRLDSRLARIDQIESDTPVTANFLEGAEKVLPFTFTVSLPIAYNSNIARSTTDEQGAFHASPFVRLDWAHAIGGRLTLFARIQSDADTYLGKDGYDGSNLLGRVGVKMAVSPKFAPYLHYTPILVYSGLYDDRLQTLNNFTGGFESVMAIGTSAKLTLDINAARRNSTVETSEQNRFGASARLEGKFKSGLAWTLSQTVQKRHYTGGTNSGRDDFNSISSASISYALDEQFTLAGTFSFEHNASDRSGKDYSFIDIGPSIKLTQKF